MASSIIEPLAKKLLQDVAANDLPAIEKTLSGKNVSTLQEAIKYSIPISSIMDTILRGQSKVHKMLGYDINTISAFHLAALQGRNEILVIMLDKELSVDQCLESDTTGLHLAAFSGKVDTVKLLLDVYNAQVNKQDKYGWTALHYGSTEGQLSVVHCLLEHGADIDLRDKDGTSAAWRAQLNKHDSIVALLCEHGDGEELLNVENMEEDTLRASLVYEPEAPVYAQVNKQAKKQPRTKDPVNNNRPKRYESVHLEDEDDVVDMDSQMRPIPGYEWVDPKTGKVSSEPPAVVGLNPQGAKPGILRPKSVPGPPHQRPMSDISGAGVTRTLPTGFKDMGRDVRKSTIRRIIRNELEAVFSDYETPQGALGGGGDGGGASGGEGIGDLAGSGVGIMTLKGIMREELDKYRREHLGGMGGGGMAGGGAASGETQWEENEDYESLYETLATLPPAPVPPSQAAPPLPPPRQNSQSQSNSPQLPPKSPGTAKPKPSFNDTVPLDAPPPPPPNGTTAKTTAATNPQKSNTPTSRVSGMVMLSAPPPSSMALQYSLARLAQVVGTDWKRLARALPIESKPARCTERIGAIEKRYKSTQEQALAALAEWRINVGKEATVDDLIIALRKCSLHNLIDEVEEVASEFTA